MKPLRARDPLSLVAEPALGPTSGTVSGWFGIVFALVVLVVAATDSTFDATLPVVLGALLLIALVWTLLLRPRIVLRRDALLLRNGFVDVEVPYGLIDRVTVRSATHVFVGKRRYIGTAVGRSTIKMLRGTSQEPTAANSIGSADNLPDFLESRVADRIRDAVPGDAGVRRIVAWPEVAVVVVLVVALVLALVR